MECTLNVNGKSQRISVRPDETRLEALRYRLDFIGTKEGCGEGDCGACTIQVDGRAVEIQRLSGRGLRPAVDLEKLGERTLMIDCDVMQADGGTRTASITGGYLALSDAFARLVEAGELQTNPLTAFCAAVSVGIVDGEPVCDLPYVEDSRAEVDMNVVMTSEGDFVEVQGTAEGAAFGRPALDRLLDLATGGISELIEAQKAYVAEPPPARPAR